MIAKGVIFRNKPKVERKPRVKTPFEQINDLIAELQAEDYKVIKCKEYEMVGKPLPYDIKALHEKRDKIRAEINKLEKEIQKGVK